MKVAAIRKDQLVDRQGKQFCLFAGLLDAAHRSGLRSIRTTVTQAPNDGNGNLAVCHAEAIFVDDEIEYIFEGVGDASAGNTGRMIAPHITRMASTRAIARALRLALNIGITALEELMEDDDSSPQIRQTPLEGRKAPRFGDDAPQVPQTPSRPATPPPSAPDDPQRAPTPIPNSAVRRPAPPQRAPAPEPPVPPTEMRPVPDERPSTSAPMMPEKATEQQIQRIIKLSSACEMDLPKGNLSKLTKDRAAEILAELSATFNKRSVKKA